MILKNRKCYQTEPGNRLDEGDASQRWSGITAKAAIQMHIVADDCKPAQGFPKTRVGVVALSNLAANIVFDHAGGIFAEAAKRYFAAEIHRHSSLAERVLQPPFDALAEKRGAHLRGDTEIER